MKSIKTKIFFIVLSSIIVASVIIGGFGVFWSNNAIRRDSVRILDLMAQVQTGGFNGMFADVEQSSEVIARYVEDNLTSLSVFHSSEEFDRYLSTLEHIAFYIANCTAHAMSVSVRFAPELTDEVSSILWRKVDGAFVKDKLSDFPVYNSQFENSWYYKARLMGVGVWTTPYYNDEVNEYVVSYGVPVYKNDKFFAVVGMDIDFDDIASIVNSISVYDTGYAFLTDEDFVVMYHRSIPSGTRIVEQAADFTQVDIKGINAHYYEYSFKNKKFRMVYKSLRNGMRLVVSVPSKEVDRQRTNLVFSSIIAVILIAVVASFWSVIQSKRLTRSLKELTESTRNIVAGEYDLNFKHRSNDEIGELMGTFILMAKSLKMQFEYINRLVYLDSMTGVKNKRAFIDERTETNKKIVHTRMADEPFEFGVIVFDINNLKFVNDNFGHKAGDLLIKNSCNLIRAHFEQSPVFRIGGDEFVVVITGKEFENRVELLTKFRSEMDYLKEKGGEPGEQVSIASGLAVYNPDTDVDFQAVFERADGEMYKAKVAMKGKENIR